jgi:hypothetical protein
MTPEEQIREVKRRHSARLLSQPGVCGVGVEKDDAGNFVLAIHVDADAADMRSSLPSEIEGYPVRLVGSGPFQKQSG